MIAALALGLCAFAPLVAVAQDAAASGSASAQVVRPLRAVSVADLSFGRIAVSANVIAGGTVTIDPRGGLPATCSFVRKRLFGDLVYQRR